MYDLHSCPDVLVGWGRQGPRGSSARCQTWGVLAASPIFHHGPIPGPHLPQLQMHIPKKSPGGGGPEACAHRSQMQCPGRERQAEVSPVSSGLWSRPSQAWIWEEVRSQGSGAKRVFPKTWAPGILISETPGTAPQSRGCQGLPHLLVLPGYLFSHSLQ